MGVIGYVLTKLKVQDIMDTGEVLADQTSQGSARTFTFSQQMHLVVVHVKNVEGRADPFGGDPTADRGIPCAADTPTPIVVKTSTVKVYAPDGARITVWGTRYG